MIEFAEVCPHCGFENRYTFDSDNLTWVVECAYCNVPILLCDRCVSEGGQRDCANCPHEAELRASPLYGLRSILDSVPPLKGGEK